VSKLTNLFSKILLFSLAFNLLSCAQNKLDPIDLIDNLEISIIKDETSSEKKHSNKNNKINSQNEITNLYKEIVDNFNEFNDTTIKGINKLKSNIKKLEKILLKISTNNKTIQVADNKKSKKINDWGFTEQRTIPKSIEIFFNIQPNTKLSRTNIGKLFQDYIEKHNLKGNLNSKNKMDKRIYRLDNELTKLFNLSEDEKNKINSCSSSTVQYPDGFNFYNYQKWIKQIYLEELKNDKVIK
jgi:hypothetical protein